MKNFRFLAALSLAIVLTGCATGNDFVRPTTTALSLGTTTKSDVLSKFGRPREEKTNSITLKPLKDTNPPSAGETGLTSTLFYSFVNPSGSAAEGISPQKAAYFYLWNDKLVAYKYTSSFNTDSTSFPSPLISKIEKNKTTEKEVVAMLGDPSGHGIYPFAKEPSWHTLTYYSFEWNKTRREFSNKELELMVNADGVIMDYHYTDSIKPILNPAPTSVPYFVTVPVKK